MIFTDPVINYISLLTTYLLISFGLGIMFGYKIQLWGDVIAVILVGLGTIIIQAYLLPSQINPTSWIIYSSIGTVIGITISFLLIEVLIKNNWVELDVSHTVTFPIILLGLIISQSLYISSEISNTIAQNWVFYSLIGFSLALVIIVLINIPINLEFDVLETREGDYTTIIKWALIGLVLGLFYTLATSQVLENIY